jgi:hypothetical protein
MSAYQEQLDVLQKLVEAVPEALDSLDAAVWPDLETREHFERVLAYVRLVLDATDADLMPPSVNQELAGVLQELINNPNVAVASPEAVCGRLLDAVARLPSGRGRDIEQEVKDAAATFQRSARQRLAALESDFRSTEEEIATARTRLEEINSEIASASEQRLSELAGSIDEIRTGFEQRLQGYETNLETEREEGLRQRGAQAATFEEAEVDRTAKANAQLKDGEQALELLKAQSHREIKVWVNEIRRMKEDSEKLVGVIGVVGTAERYGEEAEEQKKAADFWRWAAVGLGLFAVFGVIAAILEKNPAPETYGGKVALSLILGGVATYAANQSKSHRDREHIARNLQLELTAFSPFIEPLSDENKEEERRIMTRKTFGQTPAMADRGEVGPTPASLLLSRRSKKAEEEQAS